MRFPVIIEQTGPASFCVHSPDIDGCVATGDSVEDAVSGFKKALFFHFRAIREAGGKVPLPRTLVDTIEVQEA